MSTYAQLRMHRCDVSVDEVRDTVRIFPHGSSGADGVTVLHILLLKTCIAYKL